MNPFPHSLPTSQAPRSPGGPSLSLLRKMRPSASPVVARPSAPKRLFPSTPMTRLPTCDAPPGPGRAHYLASVTHAYTPIDNMVVVPTSAHHMCCSDSQARPFATARCGHPATLSRPQHVPRDLISFHAFENLRPGIRRGTRTPVRQSDPS